VPSEIIPNFFVISRHFAKSAAIEIPPEAVSINMVSSITGFPVVVFWVGFQP
jgi:hypothetical protein